MSSSTKRANGRWLEALQSRRWKPAREYELAWRTAKNEAKRFGHKGEWLLIWKSLLHSLGMRCVNVEEGDTVTVAGGCGELTVTGPHTCLVGEIEALTVDVLIDGKKSK